MRKACWLLIVFLLTCAVAVLGDHVYAEASRYDNAIRLIGNDYRLFYQRNTSPSDDDDSWQFYENEQYSSTKNPYPRDENGANCTWYAFGRAWEVLNERPNLTLGDAGAWYNSAPYPKDNTPKVGSIACWSSGQYGHVAFVEKVNEDGTITITDSSWGGKVWNKSDQINPYSYNGGFQGYIHLLSSVTFDAGSGYCGIWGSPASTGMPYIIAYKKYGEILHLKTNVSAPAGQKFLYWCETEDGTGNKYHATFDWGEDQDVTLYAIYGEAIVPVIEGNVSIPVSSISTDGFTVNFTATDNVGVTIVGAVVAPQEEPERKKMVYGTYDSSTHRATVRIDIEEDIGYCTDLYTVNVFAADAAQNIRWMNCKTPVSPYQIDTSASGVYEAKTDTFLYSSPRDTFNGYSQRSTSKKRGTRYNISGSVKGTNGKTYLRVAETRNTFVLAEDFKWTLSFENILNIISGTISNYLYILNGQNAYAVEGPYDVISLDGEQYSTYVVPNIPGSGTQNPDVPSGNPDYEIIVQNGPYGYGVYISKYIGSDKIVQIPSSIDNIPVIAILDSAFYNCANLSEISIPDSVISIGDSAFDGCSVLKRINLGNSVTNIGKYAFSGCRYLSDITMGEGLTNIGEGAFHSCVSLSSISIPNGVTTIHNATFSQCSNLSTILIPEGVTGIGANAFNNCKSLINIAVPKSVNSIGLNAFAGCSKLEIFIIPDGVTSIEEGVFYNCTNLESVTIPKSVKRINYNSFYNCEKLKDVYYIGSASQWGDINISNANGTLLKANLHFLNEAVYTVSFLSNGGTGEMQPAKVEKGADYTLPACGFTAPEGKEFDQWDKGAVGSKITVDDDIVLTAIWKDIDLSSYFEITLSATEIKTTEKLIISCRNREELGVVVDLIYDGEDSDASGFLSQPMDNETWTINGAMLKAGQWHIDVSLFGSETLLSALPKLEYEKIAVFHVIEPETLLSAPEISLVEGTNLLYGKPRIRAALDGATGFEWRVINSYNYSLGLDGVIETNEQIWKGQNSSSLISFIDSTAEFIIYDYATINPARMEPTYLGDAQKVEVRGYVNGEWSKWAALEFNLIEDGILDAPVFSAPDTVESGDTIEITLNPVDKAELYCIYIEWYGPDAGGILYKTQWFPYKEHIQIPAPAAMGFGSYGLRVYACAPGKKISSSTHSLTICPATPQEVELFFDPNGGTGEMQPVKVEKGADYTLPACGFTAPEGKEFSHWDKGPAGAQITVNEDITLAAQWKDASVDNSGKCGDNLTWTLYEDGLLIICGSGAMTDFTGGELPWNREKVQRIIIQEGVTSVGNFAFHLCRHVVDVDIADSVTRIGNHAFVGNVSLNKLDLPNKLASINEHAFEDCIGLQVLVIPEKVREIGNFCFFGCLQLKTVYIPASVTSIGRGAFSDCRALTAIQIAENNPSYTFQNSVLLTKDGSTLLWFPPVRTGAYTVPGTVKTIGQAAFLGSKLSKIDFYQTRIIESQAFQACNALKTVGFNSCLSNIDSHAFIQCSSLEGIYYYGTEEQWRNININELGNDLLLNVNIYYMTEENTYTITFDGNGGTSKMLPVYVEKDQVYLLPSCDFTPPEGKEFSHWDKGPVGTQITLNGNMTLVAQWKDRPSRIIILEASKTDLIVGESYYVQRHVEGFDYVIIHEKIDDGEWTERRGNGSGGGVGGGKASKVMTISEWIEGHYGDEVICSDVLTIRITAPKGKLQPAVIENIPDTIVYGELFTPIIHAVENAENYIIGFETINLSDDDYEEEYFESVPEDFPDGIMTWTTNSEYFKKAQYRLVVTAYALGAETSVSEKVFSIIDPSSDTHSGKCGDDLYWGFDESSNTVTVFGSGAMYDYSLDNPAPWGTDFGHAAIKPGVTSIGDCAFMGCDITGVTIADSVASIGEFSFYKCDNLTSITIPSSVKSMGGYAFGNCSKLTSVTISDGVPSIGDAAFEECVCLANVTIPGSVRSIGNGAFSNCVSLTNLTIPNSVISIGVSAFARCTGLTGITIPSFVTNIKSHTFSGCTSLTDIIIPQSVTDIYYGAFQDCTGLTRLHLPSSVVKIEYKSFYNCVSLTDVFFEGAAIHWKAIDIQSANEPLLNAAIHYGLNDMLIMPAALSVIGEEAFAGGSFTAVQLSENTSDIQSRAFADCISLESIVILNKNCVIADDAFSGSGNLVIYAKEGSTAVAYALEHGLGIRIIKDGLSD